MTITTDAQAEAVAKHIAARKECYETEQVLKSLNLPGCYETLLGYEAALAAYNAQKAANDVAIRHKEIAQSLDLDSIAVLLYKEMNHTASENERWQASYKTLREYDLVARVGENLYPTDGGHAVSKILRESAGRAYLAQKPKMRWEVHNTIDTMQSLRGGFISEEEALKYKSFMSLRHPGGHYEVREVR